MRELLHFCSHTTLLSRSYNWIYVYKYYGSVTLGDMCNIEQDRFFHCKIYGELGDSGIVYLDQLTSADGNLEFEVECVSLGRLVCVMFSTFVDTEAEYLCDGFSLLQELYEKHNCMLTAGNSWLIKSIVIRDSPHSPYQYVFTEGRILERQFPGVLRKEMILSDITGQSTKCPTRKKSDSIMEVEVWKVFITSKEQIEFDTVNGCCNLTVYGNLGNTGPIVLEERHNKFMPNKVAVFQVSFKSVGTVFKVRLEMDTTDERQMTWYLRKVKMKNINNGDEFRVNVDTLLMKSDRNSKPSIELPVSWPDIPPLPKVLYTIFIYNGHDTTENQTLSTLLTIYGEHGDSGPRMLYSKERGQKLFKPESVSPRLLALTLCFG
ncbi:hypothetical protein D918_09569 [Trichuris suis]|nr:hypothetical protein D918_09569 [Trichuris suis]